MPPPFAWTIELDKIQKNAIDTEDLEILLDHRKVLLDKRGFQRPRANITFLCWGSIRGMKQSDENLRYIFEGIQHGSVSHRSFEISS